MKLYRGITSASFVDGSGVSRKGSARTGQLYAGDSRIGAGATDIYVSECVQNALTLTAVNSNLYPHSWLSFTLSMDAAIWFAMERIERTGENGILIETNTDLLAEHGIEWRENSSRVPWEQEVSIDLSCYEKLPLAAIASFTEIDRSAFRSAVARLWDRHPEIRPFEDVLLSQE